MTTSIGGDNTATTKFIEANPWFSGYTEAAAKGLLRSVNPANHPDNYEDIEKICTNYVQQIWFNNVDPAKAMADCQAELDALLKK